jgi:drug/metabolite transporter (DMT)-like permease
MRAQKTVRSAISDRSTLVAFLFFVFIGGGAAVAIRRTYAELAPFWAGAARYLLAALVFWALAAVRRIPLPKGRALVGALLFGVLSWGAAFALIGWGLVATSASRYQILMATVPLLTVLLSAGQGLEALSLGGLAGSLLAVGGIVLTIGRGSTVRLNLPHAAAILLAAACIAEATVLIKKFPPTPPIMTNAIGMTAGGLILMVISRIAGEPWILPAQAGTWLAFLYLLIPNTIIAFLGYMFVLGRWPASRASYAMVLAPLVTIVVASTLAGEIITGNFLAGAVLVLAGVLVVALLPAGKAPAVEAGAAEGAGQLLPDCA